MVTINGVKAQNLQATQNDDKKPTMNAILSKMQENYDQLTYSSQNSQTKVSNQSQNSNQTNQTTSQNINIENFTSMFQGENGILFELLPLLLSKDKSKLSQEFMTKMLAKSGNPMLSKLIAMLPKVNKNPIQSQTQKVDEPYSPKIDDFVKTEE